MSWNLCLYRDIRSYISNPVTARSKTWICGQSLARIVGSNPAGDWMSVSCVCCVLSGRRLCDGLIARPEESECGLSECDFEASTMRRSGSIRAAEPLGGGGWYSRIPLFRINCDGEPSGCAENPDNWIFL